MFGQLGLPEMLVIMVIALLIFGLKAPFTGQILGWESPHSRNNRSVKRS
jgi:hypothetical protein